MKSPSVRRIDRRSVSVFLPGITSYGVAVWLEWRPSDRLVGLRRWNDAAGRRTALGAWWARLDVLPIPLQDHEAAWLDRFLRR